MADITKCTGAGCPWRERCYRYTAPDGGKSQSWMEAPGGWAPFKAWKSPHSELRQGWSCDEFMQVYDK